MIFRSPELRAAQLRSSWRDTPTEPPAMLRPHTLETPVAVEPRDCVQRFRIGRDRMLLVSYFADGAEYEKYETDLAGATERAEITMLARARAKFARQQADALQRLRLIP